MPLRRALVALLLLVVVSARADKIDDLARSLMEDPSYKVRVQAALVLGKLGDKRAVPALIQALSDENESVRGVAATSLGRIPDPSAANALLRATNDPSDFVRTQAKKSLELVSSAATQVALPKPRAGAKFYVAIAFDSSKGGPQYAQVVREALAKELQKLPSVTLSVGGSGPASVQALASRRLKGFVVDGNILRLSSSRAGGQQTIDCDLKAFVATYPDKAIKMMTTEGASLQTGSSPSDEMSGKKDCLMAAVEAVREDVGKFLSTVE
jgi:hypothetical protein